MSHSLHLQTCSCKLNGNILLACFCLFWVKTELSLNWMDWMDSDRACRKSRRDTQAKQILSHKWFQKITSKPIFYFMYSNTIYILNNTIIECFDIAFNKTNKKKTEKRNPSSALLQKRNQQPPFQNGSMERKLQERYSIVHVWQQNHSLQRRIPKAK